MRRIPLTTLFGADAPQDDKHHFETSWLLPPTLLACLRGLISLYIFTSIFTIWGWYGSHDERYVIGQTFSFFTWLTYWGLGFYMLFAAIHTACYARTGRSVLFDRWPRACRVLHSLLYATITTYPFLVTIVFWVLIYSSPWYKVTFTGWQNVCVLSAFLFFFGFLVFPRKIRFSLDLSETPIYTRCPPYIPQDRNIPVSLQTKTNLFILRFPSTV
jgi:hypothetical protein